MFKSGCHFWTYSSLFLRIPTFSVPPHLSPHDIRVIWTSYLHSPFHLSALSTRVTPAFSVTHPLLYTDDLNSRPLITISWQRPHTCASLSPNLPSSKAWPCQQRLVWWPPPHPCQCHHSCSYSHRFSTYSSWHEHLYIQHLPTHKHCLHFSSWRY